MLICITGVHSIFRINSDCLKRHNMHFKNVILKDSFEDLKSALDSGEVRMISLIVGQLNYVGRTQNKKQYKNIKCIKSINHKVIKSLTRSFHHSDIYSFNQSFRHSRNQPFSFGHSVTRTLGHSDTRSSGHSVTRSFGHSVVHSTIKSLSH